jgi:hypothetical protein
MNEGEGGILKEATGKYESIDFHYGWSDRYGGKYGNGEDLDIHGSGNCYYGYEFKLSF